MITSIYFSSRFKKQLDHLRKSDKKGLLAAQQAESIIDKVRHSGGDIPVSVTLKRTKHGERRAQNCKKYDLGGGYRLITLRDGNCLYFAFVGTHDDCDLWFKKQRDKDPGNVSGRVEILPAKENRVGSRKEESRPFKTISEEDIYEIDLLSRVDDATLRSVFSGLYQIRR